MQIFSTNQYGSNPDNRNEYEFVCEFKNTRNGFKHICNLFVNNRHVETAECIYYNRTWESYTYQTVMYRAIEKLILDRTNELENEFKMVNGYARMTKKRREEFNSVLNADEKIIELQRVKGQIKNGFQG